MRRKTIHLAIAISAYLALTAGNDIVTRAQNNGDPRGSISGTVRDELDRPVPGLVVTARNPSNRDRHSIAWTDLRGEYHLRALPDGDYVVSVDEENFRDLFGPIGCVVFTGLIFDLPPDDFRPGHVMPVSRTIGIASPPQEADGKAFTYVPSYAPGVTALQRARRLRVRNGTPVLSADIQLQLHPTSTLVGRIAGAPSSTKVSLELVTPLGTRHTVANDDGTFVFRDAPVGEALLRGTGSFGCGGPGRDYSGQGKVRIQADRIADVIFRLGDRSGVRPASVPTVLPAPPQMADAASISGTVTDDLGRALDRVRINLLTARDAHSHTAITARDGRFAITNIPPGVYTLEARRHGFMELQFGRRHDYESGTPLVLSARQHFTAHIRMQRPGVIVGVIRGDDGGVVPHALIQTGGRATGADASGQYRLAVDPGNYLRTFHLETGRNVRSRHERKLDIQPGQEIADVDFTVTPAPPRRSSESRGRSAVTARVAFDKSVPESLDSLAWDLLEVTDVDPWRVKASGPKVFFKRDQNERTFTLREQLPPGRYVVSWFSLLRGESRARSATIGSTDVMDHPFTVAPGDDISIDVTFTDRVTSLSGVVRAADGSPTSNATVVVFSSDRQYWTARSRRVTMARPRSDGTFRFDPRPTPLPAGRYGVAAVEVIAPDQLLDPPFLERLMKDAVIVELAEGQEVRQDVRVSAPR